MNLQENIHRIQSMMGVIIENDGPSKIDKMINQIGLGSTIKFFGGYKNFKEVYGEDIPKEDKINFINQSIKEKTQEDNRDFVNPLDYLDEDLYYYHDKKETQVMSKFYVGYVIINIYRMQGWTSVFDEAIEVPYEELTEDGLNKVFKSILEII
jgi:hypothetical protein